jgi:hypothetical protein
LRQDAVAQRQVGLLALEQVKVVILGAAVVVQDLRRFKLLLNTLASGSRNLKNAS